MNELYFLDLTAHSLQQTRKMTNIVRKAQSHTHTQPRIRTHTKRNNKMLWAIVFIYSHFDIWKFVINKKYNRTRYDVECADSASGKLATITSMCVQWTIGSESLTDWEWEICVVVGLLLRIEWEIAVFETETGMRREKFRFRFTQFHSSFDDTLMHHCHSYSNWPAISFSAGCCRRCSSDACIPPSNCCESNSMINGSIHRLRCCDAFHLHFLNILTFLHQFLVMLLCIHEVEDFVAIPIDHLVLVVIVQIRQWILR